MSTMTPLASRLLMKMGNIIITTLSHNIQPIALIIMNMLGVFFQLVISITEIENNQLNYKQN